MYGTNRPQSKYSHSYTNNNIDHDSSYQVTKSQRVNMRSKQSEQASTYQTKSRPTDKKTYPREQPVGHQTDHYQKQTIPSRPSQNYHQTREEPQYNIKNNPEQVYFDNESVSPPPRIRPNINYETDPNLIPMQRNFHHEKPQSNSNSNSNDDLLAAIAHKLQLMCEKMAQMEDLLNRNTAYLSHLTNQSKTSTVEVDGYDVHP